MTQEQLTDKLNVSHPTISKWENGVTFPNIDNILEISKIFIILSDSLLDYHSEIKPKINPSNVWIYYVLFIIVLIIGVILLMLR